MTRDDPFNPLPGSELQGSGEAPRTWSEDVAWTPSPGVQATMDQMTERLQTVIDTAERAAQAIRYDAEEQARRHLAEAQRKADRMTAERVRLISELTDDLIRQASVARESCAGMVRALEQPAEVVGEVLERPPASIPAAAAGIEAPAGRKALIHATRLAVGGIDRAAIERSLRSDYGIEDPEPIVDRVLGTARPAAHPSSTSREAAR